MTFGACQQEEGETDKAGRTGISWGEEDGRERNRLSFLNYLSPKAGNQKANVTLGGKDAAWKYPCFHAGAHYRASAPWVETYPEKPGETGVKARSTSGHGVVQVQPESSG